MEKDLFTDRLDDGIQQAKLKLRAMLLVKRNELDKTGESLSQDEVRLEDMLMVQTLKNR